LILSLPNDIVILTKKRKWTKD